MKATDHFNHREYLYRLRKSVSEVVRDDQENDD
jgi:hypothetical protein